MKQLSATLCTIGDELLIGQVVNTNSAFLARILESEGVHVCRHISISDEPSDISSSIGAALENSDIVITTGGLGPTKDDRTKQTLAELFGCTQWKEDAGQMEVIERILSRRGIPMLDINRAQASVPAICDVIVNKIGTAPIMAFHLENGKALYCMPGVPFETESAAEDVMEDIREHFSLSHNILHRSIMTYGIPESTLAKTIEAWEDKITAQGIRLAYLPCHKNGVKLRLSMYADPSEKMIAEAVEDLKALIGDNIYNYNESTIPETLAEIVKEKGLTLSVAESCTGGYLSSLFTSIPGSSVFFNGSVTSYATQVKHDVLGVSDEIIDTVGVVSSECAAAMAQGVKKALKTDVAISTTGYAGPTGENVGLVWVGVALPDGSVQTREFNFARWNSRRLIIERAAHAAAYFALQLLSE